MAVGIDQKAFGIGQKAFGIGHKASQKAVGIGKKAVGIGQRVVGIGQKAVGIVQAESPQQDQTRQATAFSAEAAMKIVKNCKDDSLAQKWIRKRFQETVSFMKHLEIYVTSRVGGLVRTK